MSRRRQPGRVVGMQRVGEKTWRDANYLTAYLRSPEILKNQDGPERGRRDEYYRRTGKHSTEELSGTCRERQGPSGDREEKA